MPEKLQNVDLSGNSVYIETYGCQMNLSDTEIVAAILTNAGFDITDNPDSADIILINTCSVRENAERKIYEKLIHLNKFKKRNKKLIVGVIGCMAERLREKLIEERKIVDLIIGPDNYRNSPDIIRFVRAGVKGIAVGMDLQETYDDIIPLRKDGISAWLAIMRGCNNYCSYCVVPYTRGRERSRPLDSLISEILRLNNENIKEITFLGQNVNSYLDPKTGNDFAILLGKAAKAAPDIRFRFTTSHPKDISDTLIETMAEYPNICKHIHLAMQSGSDKILELMNRKYTIAHFIERIEKIKTLIPGCSITTDIIAGFPTETNDEHRATLEAINVIRFDGAFMFRYSPRENTKAFEYPDDVPEDEKIRRLNEIITLQQTISKKLNKEEIGFIHEVLVEGTSKRNPEQWQGRTDTNKVTIFEHRASIVKGDLINLKITRFTSATLFGEIVN